MLTFSLLINLLLFVIVVMMLRPRLLRGWK
jgi:hypothetical protein